MIFLFLLPGYILVNLFIIVWLLRWFNNIWRKLSGESEPEPEPQPKKKKWFWQ